MILKFFIFFQSVASSVIIVSKPLLCMHAAWTQS